MTFVPPCRRDGADPDDWFIDTDGKQYRDEDLLDDNDYTRISHELPEDATEEEIDQAIDSAEQERRKENLVKRRHAIEACFNDCITRVRTMCLDSSVDPLIPHGIWGGYTPKQRRTIDDGVQKRRMGRRSTN